MVIDMSLFLQNLWIFVGAGVVTSLVGWLKHALQDNKITWPEWRKLIETVLRVGLMGASVWLVQAGAGIDFSPFVPAAGAYLLDKILRAIKYPEQRVVKRTEIHNITKLVKVKK